MGLSWGIPKNHPFKSESYGVFILGDPPKTAGAKIAFAEPGVQIKPVKPKIGLSWLQIAGKSDEGDQFLDNVSTCLNVFLPVFVCLLVLSTPSSGSRGWERDAPFSGPKVGCYLPVSRDQRRDGKWFFPGRRALRKCLNLWMLSVSVRITSPGRHRKTINLIRHVSATLKIFEYGCTKSMYRVT